MTAGYVRFANRKSHFGRLLYLSQALSSHICTPNRITSIESVALIEMVMTVSNMAIHSALFVGMLNRHKSVSDLMVNEILTPEIRRHKIPIDRQRRHRHYFSAIDASDAPKFDALRNAICHTARRLLRFLQSLVNFLVIILGAGVAVVDPKWAQSV